jgi:hypothetical protein
MNSFSSFYVDSFEPIREMENKRTRTNSEAASSSGASGLSGYRQDTVELTSGQKSRAL